ncbi:MAG: DNA-binding protein [Gammaproteobacteria bacterium]|nr:DNA-binding protein [Gammaproteobacteria bacterium]
MLQRTNILVTLIVCSSFGLFNAGVNNLAYAEQINAQQDQQPVAGRIQGKVTDTVDVSGYTYAEIDDGEKKVWAAGPVTPLKKGDIIEFSTKMPMKNFHSTSMQRDFPIIYFVSRFISNKETPTTEGAETASPHSKIKQQSIAQPVKAINKVAGGNTIAEIYSNKQDFSGKTIRVRGQVTKFTARIMGKNWLHIRDSSTLDDLTVTTNDTVAVDDIVLIEGKLGLDKDFSYGYVYPVILEDARILKE